SGMLFSDDTRYMTDALRALGLSITIDETSETATIVGSGGQFPVSSAELSIGNSGTTARFLTAALTIGHGRYIVDGNPRMRARPIGPLLDALRQLGAVAAGTMDPACPPVLIEANGLPGGDCAIPGDLSSQYFSALLMAAPYAANDVHIAVLGALVSVPYLEITAAVMAAFGVQVTMNRETWASFDVRAGQRYQGRTFEIEPDASNASYFFAAAAASGGKVRVNGLGSNSTQGDLHFVRVLEQMGAVVDMTDTYTEVTGPPPGQLQGLDIDMGTISDTAQTLAAIAPFANSRTRISGIAHNRIKETDRIADLATELRRIGQVVDEFADGLTITPGPITPASIATYDDHRMAMSFGITGLLSGQLEILDPECTAKTFPDFFARLAKAADQSSAHTG
ncbi:MAG TPA: 3-phosphoshikimate 1-carboxyvinyltransferase, partial [Thermomicrobiales bacterium]|nr:3-phosphoshikimate 1-carboxyvinyltransferase [Thermomicrobiales bacterium]